MIAIVDYGVGNIFSLYSSFNYIGADVILTSDCNKLKQADKIILPGVGAFEDAAKKLRQTGLFDAILNEAKNGKPLLGICLGMQLLFDESYEYGCHKGLGLIPGSVVPMEGYIPQKLKIPHIGWNALHFTGRNEKSGIFKYIGENEYVYFVHSYFADKCEKYVTATAEYGKELTAAVQCGNVYGTQFHPEKSGETGLKILKAFTEL